MTVRYCTVRNAVDQQYGTANILQGNLVSVNTDLAMDRPTYSDNIESLEVSVQEAKKEACFHSATLFSMYLCGVPWNSNYIYVEALESSVMVVVLV